MELKLPYLTTENGIFKIRIRIPKELKPILGKTEFYKSLQTRDPETAKQRYHQVMADYQTEIRQARHRIGGVKAFKNIPPFPIFSEEEFEKDKQEAIYNQFIKSKEIGTKQIQQEILAGKGVYATNEANKKILLLIQHVEQQLKSGIFDTNLSAKIEQEILKFAQKRCLSEAQEEIIRNGLIEATLEGLRYYKQTSIDNNVIPEEYKIKYPRVQEAINFHNKQPFAIKENKGLNYYIEKYCSEKIGKDLDIYKNKTHLIYFAEFIGKNTLIPDIKKHHIKEWRNALSNFPKQASQKKVFNNLSFKEIINKNKSLKQETLNDPTINKYISSLHKFLDWCIDEEGLINSNPANKMFLEKTKSHNTVYKPEEIKTLMTYLESTYKNSPLKSDYWWIPRIAQFSGMREKEICQLLIDDIIYIPAQDSTEKQMIWCFDINDDLNNKSVKNEHSKRIIPIHKQLIEDGFINYVEQRKKQRKERLFDVPFVTKKGGAITFSGTFGRKYAKILKELNIKRDYLNFHSWRHTLTTQARKCGVLKNEIPFILGHIAQLQTDFYGTGTDNFPIARWKRAIDKVSYDTIDNL